MLTTSHHVDWPELEATLPPAPNPIGSYVTCVRVGNLLFTSGMLPLREGALVATGAVVAEGTGSGVSIEQAKEAAQWCAMNALAVILQETGSLAQVKRVVKLVGFVNAGPEFTQHPAVINGASDYMVSVFGDAGKHARSAVGVSGLPMNASVELEVCVELA